MTVPRIDIRTFLAARGRARGRAARALGDALQSCGFVRLVAGLPPERLAAALRASREFFARPEEEKASLRWVDGVAVQGFIPAGREGLNEGRPPDLKEAFNVPPPPGARPETDVDRRWRERGGALRDEMESFGRACFELARQVLAALASALDLPERFFADAHRPEDQMIRMFHYFPADGRDPRQLGCGEHQDHGTLTLLVEDEAGGLELRDREGRWHAVPPQPGTVLVNAGDMLARWTRGALRSAPHRVRSSAAHRHSLGYFLIARPDVRLACPSTSVLRATAEPAPLTSQEFFYLRSLRRMERFLTSHGVSLAAGSVPPGLIAVRRQIAERLGLDDPGLLSRLEDFARGDLREDLHP
jgi:isopenicillin N synthase-like dioxygenase